MVLLCFESFAFVFRLRASEDIQYFQFDQDGNMFIFQPCSGFSGPAIKVEPGFEMNQCMPHVLFDETASGMNCDELCFNIASFTKYSASR